MLRRYSEVVIDDPDEPFKNDVLGRRLIAPILTDLGEKGAGGIKI